MGFKPRTFDPRLKLDVRNGCMPLEFKGIVNSGHIHKWKKEKWNHLVGFNYYNKKEISTKVLTKEIIALQQELKIIRPENEFLNIVVKLGSNSREFERLLFKNKSQIIECVEKNKKVLTIKKVSRILNINRNTYSEWKQLNKTECEFSRNFICAKRHPHRISIEEEDTIIELLKDTRYEHFPISSLIWMARYENLVYASREVWDRIRKENLIQRNLIKKRKKSYKDSLQADYVNQYLHADVTYFKIEGGKTYFIYIVKDNFSKYIKAWAVSDTINADTRIETFKTALSDIGTNQEIKIAFVADYGNENRANKVLDFIAGLTNVELLFARKDIPFSNNMIERYNMDLKYMYLYREPIKTLDSLKKTLEIAVKEHNYTKRMQRLNGQTPYEIYNGIPGKSEWILEQWKQARQNRLNKINTTICCLGEPHKTKSC